MVLPLQDIKIVSDCENLEGSCRLDESGKKFLLRSSTQAMLKFILWVKYGQDDRTQQT